MKYIRLLLPFLIFLILIYLYFNFRGKFNNNSAVKSVEKNINLKKTIPKVNFLQDIVNNTKQNFSINLPSEKTNYYSFYFTKTPYQVASYLGISTPPETTSNKQIIWQVGVESLIYTNNSYFYSIKNNTQKVDIYTFSNSILSNDFGINTINFHKKAEFSGGETILYYYPTINNDFIYKTDGEKFYDQFIFTDQGNFVSFLIYPFNIQKKLGESFNFTLTGNNMNKVFLYTNTTLSLQSISFLSEAQGYFIDLKNKFIVPIYILSAKADIINNTILPMYIYVPEIKTAS